MNITYPSGTWVGDGPYPWDNQPSTPVTPPKVWDVPATSPNVTVTWPPPVEPHPAELESFEEFVIWACGFTDPDQPPSQKKWEEFQEKVRELAAEFVEYKRAKRERERQASPYATYSASHTF